MAKIPLRSRLLRRLSLWLLLLLSSGGVAVGAGVLPVVQAQPDAGNGSQAPATGSICTDSGAETWDRFSEISVSTNDSPAYNATFFDYETGVGTPFHVLMKAQLITPLGDPPPGGWPLVFYAHGSGGDVLTYRLDLDEYPEDIGVAVLTRTAQGHGTEDNEGIDTRTLTLGSGVYPDDMGYIRTSSGLNDVMHAFDLLQFVVDNCAIDAGNIGIVGGSVGGALIASMLGANRNDIFNDGSNISSTIQFKSVSLLYVSLGSSFFPGYLDKSNEEAFATVDVGAVIKRAYKMSLKFPEFYQPLYDAFLSLRDDIDNGFLGQPIADFINDRSLTPIMDDIRDDPLIQQHFDNILDNLTVGPNGKRNILINTKQRDATLSPNDEYHFLQAMENDETFFIKALFHNRGHGGKSYGPNWIKLDGLATNCVFMEDDPAFDPANPACSDDDIDDDMGALTIADSLRNDFLKAWFEATLVGADPDNKMLSPDEPKYILENTAINPSNWAGIENRPWAYESYELNSIDEDIARYPLYPTASNALSTTPGISSTQTITHLFTYSGTVPADPYENPQEFEFNHAVQSDYPVQDIVFQSCPLASDTVMMGIPTLSATVTADKDDFQIVASIYDVYTYQGQEYNDLVSFIPYYDRLGLANQEHVITAEGIYRVFRFARNHQVRLVLSVVKHFQEDTQSWWTLPPYHDVAVDVRLGDDGSASPTMVELPLYNQDGFAFTPDCKPVYLQIFPLSSNGR